MSVPLVHPGPLAPKVIPAANGDGESFGRRKGYGGGSGSDEGDEGGDGAGVIIDGEMAREGPDVEGGVDLGDHLLALLEAQPLELGDAEASLTRALGGGRLGGLLLPLGKGPADLEPALPDPSPFANGGLGIAQLKRLRLQCETESSKVKEFDFFPKSRSASLEHSEFGNRSVGDASFSSSSAAASPTFLDLSLKFSI